MSVHVELFSVEIPQGVPARELIINFQFQVEQEIYRLGFNAKSKPDANPKLAAYFRQALGGVAPSGVDQETHSLLVEISHREKVLKCHVLIARIAVLLRSPTTVYNPESEDLLNLSGESHLVAAFAYFAEAQEEWISYLENSRKSETGKLSFSEKGNRAAAEIWKMPKEITAIIAEAEWLQDAGNPRTITAMVEFIMSEMNRNPNLFSLPRSKLPHQKTVRNWVKIKAATELSQPGRRKK